ncbi:MAG: (2Fe-2S) ferredoxin domain-containing protein [Cyanobacteria bacterium P01_A01_bin.84]
MSKSYKTEISEFYLEGTFQEIVIKDGYKIKGLLLKTADGERYIKLAKPLRAAFNWNLAHGTHLQVFGTKKIKFKTDEVSFQAERIISGHNLIPPLAQELKPEKGNVDKDKDKNKNKAQAQAKILVCQKSDCMKRGGKALCKAMEAAISDRGLEDKVMIKGTGCMKKCKAGPNVIMPDKTRYSRIQAKQVDALMDRHFDIAEVNESVEKNSDLLEVGN